MLSKFMHKTQKIRVQIVIATLNINEKGAKCMWSVPKCFAYICLIHT